MNRARKVRSSLLTLLAAAALSLSSHGQAQAATSQQVDDALKKGVAYLYSQQKNGHWDDPAVPTREQMVKDFHGVKGGQYTGQTALAVYALISAGEKPTNSKLAPAIEFLRKNETLGVYALGLRMQVWLHLPDTAENRAAAKRDFDLLLKSVKTEGVAAGMYTYVFDKPGGGYSHSRSQYGVLGVWAGEQMGFEVSQRYWQLVEKGWLDHQAADGGWTYMLPKDTEIPTTPGMTAVGIASLFITQDYTRDALLCRGNQPNPAIDRGLKWMGDNMDKVATDKRYARDFPYITLYAVERIGVAAGIKYFNGVDWYKKGANWLVGKQSANGGWTGGGGFGSGAIVDTSFAMLFLARGRAPVAFNKLDYAAGSVSSAGKTVPPAAWNQRPRDLANLTRWIGRTVEQNLNWQVVPASAPLADLLDAPVLYITGTQAINLDDESKQKLRAYVEAGGMIVGNADCGGPAFAASFRKLAGELFPTYEFRELPQDHPVYFTTPFPRSKWKNKNPGLLGLNNGVRELMILIPNADPSRTWQSRVVGGREDSWWLGGALFFYVSEGKNLAFRGENHLVAKNPKITPTRSLTVHRIEHPGNWNPEPGGWTRMAAIAHNKQRIDLTVTPVKLGSGALPASGLAHLTGTAEFKLTDDKRAELKKFVEGGGTLLIDAAGGSSRFATAVEAEIAAIFGPTALKPLTEDHAFYNLTGEKLEFSYRPAAQKLLTGGFRSSRLKGIEVNGRLAVIYSREDLSAGIVGNSVDGVIGYEQAVAADVVTNVLALVAGAYKAPTTAPASGGTTAPKPASGAKPAAGGKPAPKAPAKTAPKS
jgi:hypothetical protein